MMRLRTSLVSLGVAAPMTALLSLILISFAAQEQPIIIAGTVLCAFYALACHWRERVSFDRLLVYGSALALFAPAFVKTYHGLSPIFYTFSTLATFFAAAAAMRNDPRVILMALRVIYVAASVFVCAVHYIYWGYPEPLGMVIDGSSTNAIPSYLIVIQIGLTLSCYLVYGRLPVVTPLITAAVAFFGNGRGSLVVAAMIIAATLIFNLFLVGSAGRRHQRAFVVLFAMAVVPLSFYAEDLLELLMNYTKLSVGLADSNRLEILDQYLGKIDEWTLLVGADYSNTVIEYEYLGNPHIAYIRTHSLFGLPLTVLALISPFFVFFSRRSLSAKLVFVCFIALAALRAVSEPIFFPTLLDFFYFGYFFLFFYHAPSSVPIRIRTSPQ